MVVCVQVVEDGYEFFAKRQLVTLFSAPNYCGEFDNAGAMMSVDETLMCSFQVSLRRRRLGLLLIGSWKNRHSYPGELRNEILVNFCTQTLRCSVTLQRIVVVTENSHS